MAALNVPLDDPLSARISVGRDHRNGYVKDISSGVRRGGEITERGHLQLRWHPSDTFILDLKAEIVNQNGNGRAINITRVDPTTQVAFLASLFGGPAPTAANYGPVLLDKQYTIAGFNAPDSHTRTLNVQDVDGTPLPVVTVSFSPNKTDLFSQELQLLGNAFDSRLNWTSGLYYYNEKRF